MTDTNLRPCPFCGSVPEIREVLYGIRQKRYAVICQKCLICSGWEDSEETAVERWNRRANAMSMTDWAKREVEIACKREAPDREDGEWDYGCACYESALKAYLSLMEDEHSGASFGFTANILKRLLESKPLTPIEDTPDMWNECWHSDDGTADYQCKRMSSLFKHVSPDGTVWYSDVRRYYCEDVETGCTYSCGLEANLLNELHPITMPYYPPLGYYVFSTRELLTDRKNGDFDTKAIICLKHPDGTVEGIGRYFAEEGEGWHEISYTKFLRRREADRKRRANE